jgi:prepilin-type N-terminal cleavage/methylation domain-containing protein
MDAPINRLANTHVQTRRTLRAGFTLIEILAVLLIIGILMIILLPRMLGMRETADMQLTRAYFSEVSGAISDYEKQFGDFPPSAWPESFGAAPNASNVGAEVLVQSLWSRDWGGTMLNEDRFCNVDSDDAKKPLSRLPATALFELKDAWDNPIAYIHRRDYEKQLLYVTRDTETGELVDTMLMASKNATTKAFQHMNKFQLISAGPDGRFGTEDDIGNWTAEIKE